MNTVVLVPFRSTDEHRDRAWAFLRPLWEAMGFEVFESTGPEGPFNKAAAVNEAARQAGPWDVAVIADADMLIDANQIGRCTRYAAATGKAAWPFRTLHRLSEGGTASILAGVEPSAEHVAASSDRMPGGVVVVPRALWERASGMDERFRGWGGEDTALISALHVLGGALARTAGQAWHLWHPKAGRTSDYPANVDLEARYRKATSPTAMRALIAERGGGIPRILHHIWIGPRPVPLAWIEAWRAMHSGWEQRLWDQAAIDALPLRNRAVFDDYARRSNWPGAADVARVEILLRSGGVYVDVDSECLLTFEGAPFMAASFFAAYEPGVPARPGRVANGVLGAVAGHPILAGYVAAIGKLKTYQPAWDTVGGTLLTTIVARHASDKGVVILPPRTFYPESHTGEQAPGGEMSYTRHFWASSPGARAGYPEGDPPSRPFGTREVAAA